MRGTSGLLRLGYGTAVAACCLLWLASAASAQPAEDEPGAPAAEAPAGAFDLLAYLTRLKAQLEEHQVPPPRTNVERALYDAWSSILKPRAARMVGRVERVAQVKRWSFDETGRRVQHLKPDEWKTVIREMASLYTELGGALEQYAGVTIRFTPVPGAPGGPPSGLGIQLGLARLRNLEARFAHRRALGDVIWPEEVAHYWSLVHRVDAEMALYEERRRRWEASVQASENLQERIFAGLDMKRQTLGFQMLSVRALIAALQAAEEDRLRSEAAALEGEMATEAQAKLAELHAARLEAEAHQERPSAYGSILRQKWLIARRVVRTLLARARRAAEKEAEGS